MVKTKDGTQGQKFEIEWVFGGSTLAAANGIFVYKNGYRVMLGVTHMGDPDDIMDILDSLKFE